MIAALWIFLYLAFKHPPQIAADRWALYGFALPFVAIMSAVTLATAADLRIGEEGISRTLFFFRTRRIPWSDVTKVAVFPVFGGRGFNVLPRDGKKIAFSEALAHPLTDVVDALNYYIVRGGIRVELTNKLLGEPSIAERVPPLTGITRARK